MSSKKQLQVLYKSKSVGKLALTPDRRVAFQYSSDWLKTGFSISPFSLPLKDTVFIPQKYTFDGLFGVFADSLPDSWGRLVLDRMLQHKGINPCDIDILDRLSMVGSGAMGALEYYPEYSIINKSVDLSLDELSDECSEILQSKECRNIETIYNDCGSSGGARPKAFVKLEDQDWIVKFHYSGDSADSGRLEYLYSLCAKDCGINMSETRLLITESGKEFFGTKRFDRPKKHMLSAAAALEVDFERSLTDYNDLFKLTNIITNGNSADLNDLFRRMCFNVFAENQDDHLKNFAYLYEESSKSWRLSPAYDLTYCITGYGEHTSTINGKGRNIQDDDLLAVGKHAGLNNNFCSETIADIKEKCHRLAGYL